MNRKRLVIPLDKCVECGSLENIVMHHIIPETRGGKFVVPVCQPCHDTIHECRVRNISLSKLTIDGLNRARERGVKLGTPRPDITVPAMVEANKKAKRDFAKEVNPLIVEAVSKGIITLENIADYLNKNDILSRTGRRWYPNTVRRIMQIQGTYQQFKNSLKRKQIEDDIQQTKNANKQILEHMLAVMKEFNITKLQDIADKLNERGVLTRGGCKIRASTIYYLKKLL